MNLKDRTSMFQHHINQDYAAVDGAQFPFLVYLPLNFSFSQSLANGGSIHLFGFDRLFSVVAIAKYLI